MSGVEWGIYLEKIPFAENGSFWVSFESDPKLKKTKEDIYGRCLPCIQNLYFQLKEDRKEIVLGRAYNCWKVTAIVHSLDDALSLLSEFERRRPTDHIYGKIGSSRPGVKTKVVVFHTDEVEKRDLIYKALEECDIDLGNIVDIQISKGCAILYEELFGHWSDWRAVSKIKNPEKVDKILNRIKKVLYWAS